MLLKTNVASPKVRLLFSLFVSTTIIWKKEVQGAHLERYGRHRVSVVVFLVDFKSMFVVSPLVGPWRVRSDAYFFCYPRRIRYAENVPETAPDFNEESSRNGWQKMFVYKSGKKTGTAWNTNLNLSVYVGQIWHRDRKSRFKRYLCTSALICCHTMCSVHKYHYVLILFLLFFFISSLYIYRL